MKRHKIYYADLPPTEEELETQLLLIAEDKDLTPGQIWVKLTHYLRPALGLVLAAKVAEDKVKILFPEWRR